MNCEQEPGSLLIVEDDEAVRELLGLLCEKLTSNIIIAESASKALEILAIERIDAIVSDLNMPQMSGLDLFMVLRERGTNIPYVLLTGCNEQGKILESLECGINHVLFKPIDQKLFFAVTKNLLEQGRHLY